MALGLQLWSAGLLLAGKDAFIHTERGGDTGLVGAQKITGCRCPSPTRKQTGRMSAVSRNSDPSVLAKLPGGVGYSQIGDCFIGRRKEKPQT
jgi:hypothetical protein